MVPWRWLFSAALSVCTTVDGANMPCQNEVPTAEIKPNRPGIPSRYHPADVGDLSTADRQDQENPRLGSGPSCVSTSTVPGRRGAAHLSLRPVARAFTYARKRSNPPESHSPFRSQLFSKLPSVVPGHMHPTNTQHAIPRQTRPPSRQWPESPNCLLLRVLAG